MAIVELQKCDRDFENDRKAVMKALAGLRKSAEACALQAAVDFLRAARSIRGEEGPYARDLASLVELVSGFLPERDFAGIRDACARHTSGPRRSLDMQNPVPADHLVVAAMDLGEAAGAAASDDIDKIFETARYSVMSRASSGTVLGRGLLRAY